MMRALDERMRGVRRLLAAASAVYQSRTVLREPLMRATGLSAEGVELGFESLEREASEAELRALLQGAVEAPAVHVILSANVFVAPLRALALARAASARVTVRPSSRDPVMACALVEAAADPGLVLVSSREDLRRLGRGEIHVYGRDATVVAVRAAAPPSTIVRAHGAGMGIAVVTRSAELGTAADTLARDVVAFDQRGCLSPRIVLVEGERAYAFAAVLDERLAAWGARVPRGALSSDEAAAAVRWSDAIAFGGRLWRGGDRAVGLVGSGVPLDAVVAPSGRHVLVAPLRSPAELSIRIGALAHLVVAVGTDAPQAIAAHAPPRARVSALGAMQRPRLDGPVDLRLMACAARAPTT